MSRLEVVLGIMYEAQVNHFRTALRMNNYSPFAHKMIRPHKEIEVFRGARLSVGKEVLDLACAMDFIYSAKSASGHVFQ